MRPFVKPEWAIFGIVYVICLTFAAFTLHEWEDFRIIFRVGKNLAEGNGFVYTPGERLQTSTSPLGTLIPASFVWLLGSRFETLAVWLFRVLSAGALAAGLVLLYQTLKSLELKRISCWLTIALIGLESKIVDFTINGMESGLLIFFLAVTVHGLIVEGPRQAWRMGVGAAGLMWSRPDSCVYIFALLIGGLVFLRQPRDGKAKLPQRRDLIYAAALCTLLYLPWFLWAWNYYGSPVPHSVLAKSINTPPHSLTSLATDFLHFPSSLLTLDSSALITFLPPYSDHGGWPKSHVAVASTLALIAAFAWLLPLLRPATRMFSLAYFIGTFYLTSILKYYPPWYFPAVAFLGSLVLGLLFDQALCFAPRLRELGLARGWFRHLSKILHIAALVLVIGELVVLVCVARQMRMHQQLVEHGLRKPIGLWLREHAKSPADTVMLEPLGYIGYYSQLKMLDYPGLGSMEMVQTRKALGFEKQNQACRILKPDWLVLRPMEQSGRFVDAEEIKQNYELVQLFDASEKIKSIRWLPGRPYLQYDQTFGVFKRKPDTTD